MSRSISVVLPTPEGPTNEMMIGGATTPHHTDGQRMSAWVRAHTDLSSIRRRGRGVERDMPCADNLSACDRRDFVLLVKLCECRQAQGQQPRDDDEHSGPPESGVEPAP